MIKIKETIIVEGEYDKKRVKESVIADVLACDGFRVFKDKKTQSLIKKIAEKNGIIILTDSDRAGFIIRNFIKSCNAKERVLNAFIPEIKGKEKRKSMPGKEGILGVEGIDCEIIKEAIIKSGATIIGEKEKEIKEKFTKLDLYRAGFYGKENSKIKRQEFLRKHDLPEKISASMLVDVLNLLSQDEKEEKIELF